MSRTNDLMSRFTEAFRQWADRPPRLSAEAAALRVRRAIENRAPHPHRGATFALAVTCVLAATLALLLRTHMPSQPTVRPAVGGGVVVMWLDRSTTLYMNLEPLQLEKGATP